MSDGLLTDLDILPATVDVGLQSTLPLQSLPSKFPTSTTYPPRDWSSSPDAGHLSSSFLYLDRVRHVCYVSGKTVKICNASGYGDPVIFTFDQSITAAAALDHSRVHQLLVFASGRQLHFTIVQPTLNDRVHFVPVQTFGGILPCDIKVIKGYDDGKALMGGEDGNVYDLNFHPKTTFVENGFQTRIRYLTWEWKQLLAKPGVVRDIAIDIDRRMAYAIHAAGEIEVLSLTPEKPFKVAVHRGSVEVRPDSFAVLPKIGFDEATLLGLSTEGDLVFYALDRHLTDPASEVTKRAKTWCGIGLHHNLRIVGRDDQLKSIFADAIRSGAGFKLLQIHQTTIVFAVHSSSTGLSQLWELKNGTAYRGLQRMQDAVVRGSVEGISVESSVVLMPSIGGQEQEGHELDVQFDRLPIEMVVYSKEQQMKIIRRWPKDVLSSLIEREDATLLSAFLELYGTEETAAMCVGLAVRGSEAVEKLLLRHEGLTSAIDKGVAIYFGRVMRRIWLSELFGYKNEGMYLYGKYVLRIRRSASVLQAWKERARQLVKYLMEFLKSVHVDVYESRAVYVHSTSPITQDQAVKLVRILSLSSAVKDSLSILEYLGRNGIALEERKTTKDSGLLRDFAFMSTRDFVGTALNRPAKLKELLEEIKKSLTPLEGAKLDRFLKSHVPLLDPSPEAVKEDYLGSVLPQRLKELRKKIRSINEKLGRFTEEEIPDEELRTLELMEHHGAIFETITALNEDLNVSETSQKIEEETLKFLQVIKEIEHDQMKHAVVLHLIRSPLGGTPLLCQDPIFESVLDRQIPKTNGYPIEQSLTVDQLTSIKRLRDLYERTMRHEEAGTLYVLEATRKPDDRLEGPPLNQRLRLLRKAQEKFNQGSNGIDVKYIKHRLEMQQRIAEMIRKKYEPYEKDPEDEQMLMSLEMVIYPPNQLKSMAEALLTGPDGTDRIFQGSDYSGVEELVDDIY